MRSTTRLLAVCGVLLAALISGAAFAQSTTAPHNPYTIQGFFVRGELQVGIPEPFGAIVQDMGPVIFQEIAPCTLVSTLEADNYAALWGGPKFGPFESRTYKAVGALSIDNFVNPCSGRIPATAKALALRVHAVNPSGPGTFALSWGNLAPNAGLKALDFAPTTDGVAPMEEAGVMLNPQGTFTLAVNDTATDAVVEVTGYFLRDTLQPKSGAGLYMWNIEGDQYETSPTAGCISVPADAVAIQCTATGFASSVATNIRPVGTCSAIAENGCLTVYAYGHYKVTLIGPTNPNP